MNSTIFQGAPTLTGNILFVDAVNGNDSTGAVGNANKPYLTLGAAKAAASSGQLVWVRPGSYTVTDSILKNGVNWWFSSGASVSFPTDTSVGILDDKGVSITCSVFGNGDFTRAFNVDVTGGTVKCSNASSNITIGARSISATQSAAGSGVPAAVWMSNGTLKVKVSHSLITTDAAGIFDTTVYWNAGDMHVDAPIISGTSCAIFSTALGSGQDNMYVHADEIFTIGTSYFGNVIPGVIGIQDSTNANAAIWITADTVKATLGSDNCSIFQDNTSVSKLYVQCQKFYGDVRVQDGLVYVTSTKAEAITNVSGDVTALFATCTGGTLRWNVQQHDPKAFTGISHLVNGGTLISNEIEYTAGSGSDGLSISSGTARLQTPYLSTTANTSGFPITKSGGVLILMAATLVSNGTQASINAGTAQNVVAMSSWANNLANVNVTVTTAGGLTVNAAVV